MTVSPLKCLVLTGSLILAGCQPPPKPRPTPPPKPVPTPAPHALTR